ncbi:LANO_0G08702g1_1 [Lachancea nothofagi CBS 11611]|uniref:Nuclear pore complex protein n=1 Tax=Lachancea nothofagi CBS 11611 TaxID=1266666 RepID=A0A1G4KI71_9SACH|nr:LANO_0G08702g1_1 [Lachancea nothofagi CBS 11611]
MDANSAQNSNILVKFANVLKEFEISELTDPGSKDVFDVVKDFRSVAGEGALELVTTNTSTTNRLFENWDLEAKLWHLIELLVNYRCSDISLEGDNSQIQSADSIYRKSLLENDRSLYELWLIIVWIQSNIKIPERPEKLGSSKWSNSFISGDLKSSDLDYPLRDPSCNIDAEDKQLDRSFYKYAYELILAGNMDEARKECEYTDNLTLALILCGTDNDIDLDDKSLTADNSKTQGTVQRKALWRRAVYSMSMNEDLDEYERAIYSYLAGDVEKAPSTVKSDWDVELLRYLNQSWQITLENHMLKDNLVDTNELIVPMENEPLPLQAILDTVSRKHIRESEHPLRVLMGAVMLDKVPMVVKSSVTMLVDAIKGLDSGNDMVEEPYLLRVVTHLTILIDMIYPGSIDEQDKSRLITAYVTILSLYDLNDVIPVYISFLSESEVLEAYSFFLSKLGDTGARQKQLELCRVLHMPTANILRRTTQRVFDETENYYASSSGVSVHSEVDETDKRLITGAEWLIEGRLYVDALDSLVVISRRFLINGKINSLRYVFEKEDLANIIKNYELDTIADSDKQSTAVAEIYQYQSLINVFKQFEQWKQLSTDSSTESSIPQLLKSFRNISGYVYKVIKSFLMELSEEASVKDQDVLHEIRTLYIPHMVIELHGALVAAAEKLKVVSFISEALALASLVANETDRIYLLFQSSGRLEEYLQTIARTATLARPQINRAK